jgi:hypothetical protein
MYDRGVCGIEGWQDYSGLPGRWWNASAGRGMVEMETRELRCTSRGVKDANQRVQMQNFEDVVLYIFDADCQQMKYLLSPQLGRQETLLNAVSGPARCSQLRRARFA